MINSSWYKSWHEHEHHRHFHWLIFIAIALICTVLLWTQIKVWLYTGQEEVVISLSKAQAMLSLSPQYKVLKVGETFSVDIILDTANGKIDAVDIYSLHYDPTILKVVDDVANQSGIQIKPGPIMNSTAVNTVEEASGTIKFGRLSAGGTTFTGIGVLATINFQTLASGSSYLKFDFNKTSTTDTNAAHRGKDQLVRVVDAIYMVTAK